MMNHHLPAGPHMNAPAMSTHQPSRRQQEYHNQFHAQMPHSPAPLHNPYAAHYGPPAYYAHAHAHQHAHPHQHVLPGPHMGYAPRWQPQPFVPAYMPPPQYPPRSPMSPMIVSSQAPQPPPMTPVTRHAHLPYMPPPSQSPTPLPHTPHTPSSSIAPQPVASPSRPSSGQSSNPPAPTSRRSSSAVTSQPSPQLPTRRLPFYPHLPWYSHPDEPFPPKALKRRRKRQELVQQNDSVALPSRDAAETQPQGLDADESEALIAPAPSSLPPTIEQKTSTKLQASEAETLQTPLTPTAAEDGSKSISPQTTTPQARARRNTRTALPIIPAVPNVHSARPKTTSQDPNPSTPDALTSTSNIITSAPETKEAETTPVASSPKPTVPKSWAAIARAKNGGAAPPSSAVNGASASAFAASTPATNGTGVSRASSVAEALKQYNVDDDDKITFLEPRGLENPGNMCYMNSILQILVFCTPFYNFLDQVSKRAAHSFKSDTPLVDAMIMFMKEFKPIDSADSADALRMRLKPEDMEKYGPSITPEYVYDAIKRLPRFATMSRGHQQDAEEFLGFLIDCMHDECAAVIRSQSSSINADQEASPTVDSSATDNGWLEVGPKQKASVTRETGDLHGSPSPLTRIFGGQLRSELRVSGLKTSVTLEAYKPLQLDIGAPQINNIIDAMRAITKPETLTGDFGGRDSKATKQVFIESLPPVLILHLKRFQYDSAGGTQKIYKKVGYPLQLDIPKEVFAPQKRGALGIAGEPKYRLTAVVYHHGERASGGHYTVDILRQDEKEWIRIDDTTIRRIRAGDVAEGGSEEDPKVLARALEQHSKDDPSAKRNLFDGLNGDDDSEDVNNSWNEVNGSGSAAKKRADKLSGVAANAEKKNKGSGRSTPASRFGISDHKVAYILLYERMKG